MISKTSLKQTMVREIWPNIRKHEIELAELLIQASQIDQIPEEKAAASMEYVRLPVFIRKAKASRLSSLTR